MTKTQLIEELAKKLVISKRMAVKIVNHSIENIMEGVKDGEVKINGFGTFKKSKRSARVGINPLNPSQKIKFPAVNVIIFKAGSLFKSILK